MDVRDKAGYEMTPENEAAEEAAFEAACAGTDLEPAPSAAAASAEADAATALQQQGAQQAEPATAAEPEKKEPTIAEVLAMIEEQKTERQKLNDKVFGKVGDLEQRLTALKSTASGLHPKAKERLKADFVELHDMLFGGDDDGAPAEPQQVAPAAAQAQPVSTMGADGFTAEQRMELRLLKRDHPDYEQVARSPEFAAWQGSALSPDDAAALNDAWDADLVSKRLSEFKAFQAASSKQASENQIRQNRLNDAINPRGVPRVGTSSSGDDDEEAAMMASYGKNHR